MVLFCLCVQRVIISSVILSGVILYGLFSPGILWPRADILLRNSWTDLKRKENEQFFSRRNEKSLYKNISNIFLYCRLVWMFSTTYRQSQEKNGNTYTLNLSSHCPSKAHKFRSVYAFFGTFILDYLTIFEKLF